MQTEPIYYLETLKNRIIKSRKMEDQPAFVEPLLLQNLSAKGSSFQQ